MDVTREENGCLVTPNIAFRDVDSVLLTTKNFCPREVLQQLSNR